MKKTIVLVLQAIKKKLDVTFYANLDRFIAYLTLFYMECFLEKLILTMNFEIDRLNQNKL